MCNRSSSLLQEGGAYHRFNHYAYLDMSWSRATTDTCVARSVLVEKAASNTALDEILPCIYNSTAQVVFKMAHGAPRRDGPSLAPYAMAQ
uniref:Uncharacterized protein n=1 Tax=Brassica oleracea var. oleracea TaxID=109376 RepID=A0A0D3CG92_BRAOL